MLHGGNGNGLDGLLHGDGEHLVHFEGDVLNGALRDPDHSALDDFIRAEQREVGFGDDLELHPRDFAEHHGEALVGLDAYESTALDAEACAQVKATGDMVFLVAIIGGYDALGGEEESIKGDISAPFEKAVGVPLESSVYIADVQVKVNAAVVDASVVLVEITVQEAAFEKVVRAGILNQIFLTLAERQKLDR